MSVRLGDLLIQNKLINEFQLQEALHAQTIFGGKLGTNLVELGYLNEQDLAKLLSRQLGIPCVEAGELEGVDPKVIAAVPTKIVQKHMVFPLTLSTDGRILRLAMSDPTNLPALDEVSFATGLRIDPVVAPEILLVYAIEKNYDVPRMVRYIRATGMAQNLSDSDVATGAARPKLASSELLEPVPAEEEAPNAPQRADESDERAVEGYPMRLVVTELVKASRVAKVMEVIRSFVSQEFQYVVVFSFQGNTAVGATHLGGQLSQEEFQEFNFPVDSSEVLFKVFNTREPSRGMPTLSGIDRWYYTELKLPSDKPVLCLPVITGNEVVSIILAIGNKKGDLLDMMDQYKVFTRKLGMAFELITQKNRILDLSELD